MDNIRTYKNAKRSLVLAGGGVRLAYHAGGLIALQEEGISFNHIDGTSGGIFGTAMLASGISPFEAAKRWRNLDLKEFISAMPVKKYARWQHLAGLGSSAGIRKKIFPTLGINIQKINSNAAFQATFNVCNFSKKTIETLGQNEITEDHLVAGMSLPVFMPAIKIARDWYTDAVWIKDANLTEAANKNSDEIWLIWCIGNTPEYLNGFFNQYVHMIEISANSGLFAEIEWLKNKNQQRVSAGLKAITLNIIKPKYPLPLDPDFMFNKINADTLINMGYAHTKQYLKNLDNWNFENDPTLATAMEDPGTTLHFRQTFQGEILMSNLCHTVIQLSIFIREIGNNTVLEQYSSICIDGINFISGYNNELFCKDKHKLESIFDFNFNKLSYRVSLRYAINHATSFLLALEAKVAEVNISANGENTKTVQFTQPANIRLKNAFYINVNSVAGYFQKIKAKKRLINALITPQ